MEPLKESNIQRNEKHRKDKNTHHHHSSQKKRRLVHFETLLSNNTSTYGSVIDRFLPVNDLLLPDKKFYNHQHHIFKDNLNSRINGVNSNTTNTSQLDVSAPVETNFLIDGSYNLVFQRPYEVSANTNPINGNNNFTNTRSLNGNLTMNTSGASIDDFPNLANMNPNNLTHQESVANALGYKSNRVLNFKPLKSPKKSKSLHDEIALIEQDIHLRQEELGFNNIQSNSESIILPEIPFKVLNAPGLRNDYYANLVCWANKSNLIAAGLGSTVYCWNENEGTIPLESFGDDIISTLAYNSDDFLAVGTKESKIYIYAPASTSIIANLRTRSNSSICSIKWIPNSKYFFVGNDIGEVSLFKLYENKTKKTSKAFGYNYTLKLKTTFKCDQQQICGIDINNSSQQLAIGANNNNSSIWDISDLLKPKKMFHLKHEAAVKAVAFCPWMPNLLVTGGGSRDKTIRFWHSKSGTLISQFKTKAQVTAIIWSRSKKELLVTFGFGDMINKNEILAVYSYPSMKLKLRVTAPYDTRILTADISDDFNSVCTSLSDQSVRIYNIWDSKYDFKSGIYDDGIYGSKIIDTEEGVSKSIDTIR